MTSTIVDDKDARKPSSPAHKGSDHQVAQSSMPSEKKEAGAEITSSAKRPLEQPTEADPPLPYDEELPPLPDEPVPAREDDGWDCYWHEAAQQWVFYNKKTGVSQWENPRMPAATAYNHTSYARTSAGSAAPMSSSGAPGTSSPPKRKWGGYNPAIHGSYDPNADYAIAAAKEQEEEEEAAAATAAAASGLSMPSIHNYTAQANFNRFTGKFQQAGTGPEMHNDENKSNRQMNAFFDVDAAANSHDGRSLKAERRGKTLTKKELQAYQRKRHDKKEEKRRAWLMN